MARTKDQARAPGLLRLFRENVLALSKPVVDTVPQPKVVKWNLKLLMLGDTGLDEFDANAAAGTCRRCGRG